MDPPYPKIWVKQFSDMLISVINGLSVTDNEVLEKKIMSLSLKLWKIAHVNYFDNLPISNFFFQRYFFDPLGPLTIFGDIGKISSQVVSR